MYKIAIIIPYFGQFPVWIDLFLYSCNLNYQVTERVTIDWLIFTDDKIPSKVYKNTHFIQMTFTDYCKLVSEKLDIEFSPQKAYKLCDVKPFYGIIHNDYLKDYTHWGFGDLDLCYGNLSKLINEKKLNRYKLITTHADRVAGHFTVIKISSSYTNLCRQITCWKEKLQSEKLYGLDEHDFTNLVRPSMAYWEYAYRHFLRTTFKKMNLCIYDFMKFPNFIHNLCAKNYIREFYTSPLPKVGEQWLWDISNNKILNPKRKELPYLHFLFFKKTPFWDTPYHWKSGFYQVEGQISNKGYVVFDNERIIYKENL